MLVELATVGVQRTENTHIHALFAGPAGDRPWATRNRALSRDQLLLKMGHSRWDMVKVICCQSQSARMWLCCDTHCSMALKPQLLQAFDIAALAEKSAV